MTEADILNVPTMVIVYSFMAAGFVYMLLKQLSTKILLQLIFTVIISATFGYIISLVLFN